MFSRASILSGVKKVAGLTFLMEVEFVLELEEGDDADADDD